MRLFLDLLWFFKLEKKSYLLGILFLIIVALLNLYQPYVVRNVVDNITENTLTVKSLGLWVISLLLSSGVIYILRYFWRILIFGSAIRLSRLLRNKLFDHFTQMSPSFYHRHRTGDLMAHATNDIQAIEMTAGQGVFTLVDSLTTGGLVIFSMAYFLSWKLTLITLVPMPIMAWATSHYGTLLHNRFFKAQEAFSTLNDKVQENISGIRVIKAFGQEEAEINSFKILSSEVVAKNIAVAKVDSLFDPTIMVIVGFSFFLAIAFGAREVVQNHLTLGELTQFTLYLGLFIWPMLAFGWLFNIVERGRASYDRVKRLLDIKPEIQNSQTSINKYDMNGDLTYSISSFYYPGQAHPALKDIHFTLLKGRTLGIAGKTGSGKTTLLRLLMREFDATEGSIKIGGTPITGTTLSVLRSKIGYVPQEHFLFSTTIAENIALGKPTASIKEIKEAAQLSSFAEEIEKFPEGYETRVGDRGVTLSGGQKQRLSIARSFLLNPEILIIDDALSAVDAQTEKSILHALKAKRLGKTTLISSHRLSAIEHADLIIILDEGRILEQGTHQELIDRDGWYAQTYRTQQFELHLEERG